MTIGLTELSETMVESLNEDITPEEITRETTFFIDGLGLDSIDVLELVVAIEQRWGVRIDNKELGQKVMVSVGTLLDYIQSKVSESGSA